MQEKHKPLLKGLIIYYGILQSLHLIILIRAGILLLGYKDVPFPILPPPTGWQAQSLPFMYGLAGMDTLGIILGIVFAGKWFFRGKLDRILGLLSLTIFTTGAVVFAAGTFPAGAWLAHPLAYWLMGVLFTPTLLLTYLLIKMGSN